ncbi:MAG: hypothetical protein EOP24_27515 [Hyphomicrobiales bacterium]|nr:MAG: hypothetical protein EOP24_27515 [Hyphomicrobiales bacterium]
MTEYVIKAEGCDDATLALVTLTDEQAATARMLADAINARSDSGCKPNLYITPRSEADPDDIESATEPTERH